MFSLYSSSCCVDRKERPPYPPISILSIMYYQTVAAVLHCHTSCFPVVKLAQSKQAVVSSIAIKGAVCFLGAVYFLCKTQAAGGKAEGGNGVQTQEGTQSRSLFSALMAECPYSPKGQCWRPGLSSETGIPSCVFATGSPHGCLGKWIVHQDCLFSLTSRLWTCIGKRSPSLIFLIELCELKC